MPMMMMTVVMVMLMVLAMVMAMGTTVMTVVMILSSPRRERVHDAVCGQWCYHRLPKMRLFAPELNSNPI